MTVPLLCAALVQAAQLTALEVRLTDAIQSSRVTAGSLFAISVARIDGTEVVVRNNTLRMIPASNQKLLACAYALHELGPDHRPETRVWNLNDRVLVDAPGDPSLSTARLQEAQRKLCGLLKPVYVRQAFMPGVPPTWEADDLPHRYAAPVYAFTVDQGAFRIRASGGQIEPLPFEFMQAVAILHTPGTGPVRVDYDLGDQRVRVKGNLPTEPTTLDTLALRKPHHVAASFLGRGYRELAAPPITPPTFTIPGDPTSDLVRDCLTPSDNQYAEQLLLMTASRRTTFPSASDPYPAARRDLTTFLTGTVGVPVGDVRPMDGSGLSRQNLVTTRGLVRLLAWADRQPWREVWLRSLAAPGRGTLRNRLPGSAFLGKTGTLTSVSALSGYLTLPTGERVILSMMLNSAINSPAEMREFLDQVVRIVETSGGIGLALAWGWNYDADVEETVSHSGPHPSSPHWLD